MTMPLWVYVLVGVLGAVALDWLTNKKRMVQQ